MSIGIGIDISKDKVDVASSDGRWSAVFPQTGAGLQELAQTVARPRGLRTRRIVLNGAPADSCVVGCGSSVMCGGDD